MGNYINPSADRFIRGLKSQIYVDKSGLIAGTNAVINTEQCCICLSRPRRFGKTMGLNMLAAYYGCGADTRRLFETLAISHHASYAQHINKYIVLSLNMQDFLSRTHDVEAMFDLIRTYVTAELKASCKTAAYVNENDFIQVMMDAAAGTGKKFVILIDEWDCIFREFKDDTDAQKRYLDFLRSWLKDKDYIALAYMTGILPIKKYGTHSALNMFTEYSMTDPGNLAPYFGFAETEVKQLCSRFSMNFDEARSWYDGYEFTYADYDGPEGSGSLKHISMYNPKSVVEAMIKRRFGTYWNRTETYEALRTYIQLNMEGLRDAVTGMLGGGSVPVNIGTFVNDMTTFSRRDDVLTLLVHLGYLTYDADAGAVRIPNREVSLEYVNAVSTLDWTGVNAAVEESRNLLDALWNMDEEAVAAGVERAHYNFPAVVYNDENSLACTLQLAFYAALDQYTIVREWPAGKGFADIMLIPRSLYADRPAAILELKWNKDAAGALSQIRERNYPQALENLRGGWCWPGSIMIRRIRSIQL